MSKRESPPLRFAWAKVDELLAQGGGEMVPLHWEEAATDKDKVPLDIDWERARKAEREGVFRTLGMWRGTRLIGYDAFVVMPHFMHATTLYAVMQGVYCDESERGCGVTLIRRAETMLAELVSPRLVKIVYDVPLHVKLGHGTNAGSVGELLRKLGYIHESEGLSKIVRKP